jgi:hypothetical protein
MQQLAPEFLAEIARQIAFLGAFLGGFSATFLVEVVIAREGRRAAGWAIGAAALASVAFITGVIAATGLVIMSHPNAPQDVREGGSLMTARILAVAGFVLGLYALLIAIGVCGFLRSRRTGVLTSILGAVGLVLATWAMTGF